MIEHKVFVLGSVVFLHGLVGGGEHCDGVLDEGGGVGAVHQQLVELWTFLDERRILRIFVKSFPTILIFLSTNNFV